MTLRIGIVGLPNVGKSTIFTALTRSKQANVQNYPFCTIEPNIGVVEVPDGRLAQLAAVSQSKKIIPTVIEFVDIAGLVKGASEGEGLGNKFLSHIREVDAIAQVVRAFNDDNIIHVHNRVDPKNDADIINLELVLADWQTVSKRLETTKKSARGVPVREMELHLSLLERLNTHLQIGKPARELEYTEDEMKFVKELHLLTIKPMLYLLNVKESGTQNNLASGHANTKEQTNTEIESRDPQIEICAKLEAELADLSPEDARAYIKELGMTETGLDKLIVAGYKLLDLITFFTSGEPETRAWTVRRETKGPDVAGVIHTDFIKGYIKADVVNWKDFVECNGWTGVKEKGKIRLEGKEYVAQDGDVCYFHIFSR